MTSRRSTWTQMRSISRIFETRGKNELSVFLKFSNFFVQFAISAAIAMVSGFSLAEIAE